VKPSPRMRFLKIGDIDKMGTRSCSGTRIFLRCEEIWCLWNAKKMEGYS